MKTKLILTLVVITLFMVGAPPSTAQTAKQPFWVVEGNINHPTYTIIRFYDESVQLIKEERVEGKFLDIKKKKNQRILNRMLEELLPPQPQVVMRKGKSKTIQ